MANNTAKEIKGKATIKANSFKDKSTGDVIEYLEIQFTCPALNGYKARLKGKKGDDHVLKEFLSFLFDDKTKTITGDITVTAASFTDEDKGEVIDYLDIEMTCPELNGYVAKLEGKSGDKRVLKQFLYPKLVA